MDEQAGAFDIERVHAGSFAEKETGGTGCTLLGIGLRLVFVRRSFRGF